MSDFSPIIANLLLLIAATGYGGVVRPLLPRNFSRLDRLTFTLLVGFGILGTILFCIGQMWFSRSAILLVLLLGSVLSFRPLARAVRECHAIFAEVSVPLLPAVVIGIVLLVTAVGGLALPTGDLNNDSIAYHYLGPKVWLRDGVIHPVPDEVYTYFPVVVETQYAALMSLGGQRAPDLFAVIGFASILLIVASLALRLGLEQSGAWWAAALIATMPAAYRGVYGGFLDALFAAFLLAACRIAFDAERPAHFALLGILCGIAMATKYTGLIAWGVLTACAFVVLVWAYRRAPRTVLAGLGISSATAIALASPFYLRNWLLYGCPIYPPPPVLLRFFPGTHILPAVSQAVASGVRETGHGMGRSIGDFLRLPFNITYHTANFRGAGGIGLVPLALAPFGVAARRRDAFALGLLLFAVLQVVAWFVTAQESRFAIDVYAIGVIFGVAGWQYVVRESSVSARALAGLAVAVSVVYGLAMIVPGRIPDLRAAWSNSYEATRRHAEIPYLDSIDDLNADPSVQRVLILNEGISAYYLDKSYIKAHGRWGEQVLPDATDPQKLLAQVPDLRVSHVLDVQAGGRSFELPDNPPGLTLVFERSGQRIYRVD